MTFQMWIHWLPKHTTPHTQCPCSCVLLLFFFKKQTAGSIMCCARQDSAGASWRSLSHKDPWLCVSLSLQPWAPWTCSPGLCCKRWTWASAEWATPTSPGCWAGSPWARPSRPPARPRTTLRRWQMRFSRRGCPACQGISRPVPEAAARHATGSAARAALPASVLLAPLPPT